VTRQFRPGDLAVVTRTSSDGRVATWIGAIDRFDTDPAAEGFRLTGHKVGGDSMVSYFAASAVLAADPGCPIIQTIEPLSEGS
jgi:hypothetical protein